MNASSASPGRTKPLVLAALVAAFGMLALAGTSKAAPVDHNLNVDHGKLTLGAVFPDNTIIPAPVATTDCPSIPPHTGTDPDACGPSPLSILVPNYPDGNAHITVSADDSAGTATVSAANFKTPMTYVPKPGDPGTMVPIKTTAPNGLTGTWDPLTGELSLTGDLRIDVATGVNPDPPSGPGDISWCRIDAPNITWSTGLNAVTPGIPFTDAGGLDGTGAISAQWSDLPNGTEINQGDCSTVNAVIHDTGAIWFGVGKDTPPPPPVCEPPYEGLWPDCTLIPVPKANITGVRVAPKKARTRAGRKVRLRVRVTNRGDRGKWVRVHLKVNRKRGVRLRHRIRVYARPDATSQARVVFRTTRRARGRYVVTARGAGKSGRSVIRVKPVRKKRH